MEGNAKGATGTCGYRGASPSHLVVRIIGCWQVPEVVADRGLALVYICTDDSPLFWILHRWRDTFRIATIHPKRRPLVLSVTVQPDMLNGERLKQAIWLLYNRVAAG